VVVRTAKLKIKQNRTYKGKKKKRTLSIHGDLHKIIPAETQIFT